MKPRTPKERSALDTTAFFRSLTMREFDAVMKFYRSRRLNGLSTNVADAREYLARLLVEESKQLEGNGFDDIDVAA